MEKWRRSERMVAMTKFLLENCQLFTLGYFSNYFIQLNQALVRT